MGVSRFEMASAVLDAKGRSLEGTWGVSPARALREFPHPFSAPLCGLCLLLLSLDAGLIVEPAFFDLREKTLFGQFFLEVLDGLFYLIVLHDNFHQKHSPLEDKKTKGHLPEMPVQASEKEKITGWSSSFQPPY